MNRPTCGGMAVDWQQQNHRSYSISDVSTSTLSQKTIDSQRMPLYAIAGRDDLFVASDGMRYSASGGYQSLDLTAAISTSDSRAPLIAMNAARPLAITLIALLLLCLNSPQSCATPSVQENQTTQPGQAKQSSPGSATDQAAQATPVIDAAQGTQTPQAEKAIMTMRMKLLSIRNRSSGPVPVRITIKYNRPQFLEGDLELAIYDALENPVGEDLIATFRHEGIVLAGQDLEFNILLPPMRTAAIQNWAIVAAFITKDGERILLSSVLNSVNQEPYDLLVTSPLERGTLVCSAAADPVGSRPSANRRFLESSLSLDSYNPFSQSVAAAVETSEGDTIPADEQARISAKDNAGRTVIHYAVEWPVRDLPTDPLSYCAFDIVTLSDGSLARMDEQQLASLTKWVRAGGSVCVLPDSRLKPIHLNFLRTLFRDSGLIEADLSLASDGSLLVMSDENEPVLLSHFGLGRAVLLPNVESLEQRLSKEDLARVVAFLWKVRKSSSIWNGKPWDEMPLKSRLRSIGIEAQEDANGIYVDEDTYQRHFARRARNGGVILNEGRYYIPPDTVVNRATDLLNPVTEPLLAFSEQALLPSDVEMVPTWVVGLILAGYVLTIGPIDYFVLGWLRLRKFTWVLFPVVTLVFTGLTIVVANSYMGSEDTGGRLVITDLVEDGIAVRETVLETLFFGAQADVKTEHASQLIVQAEDSFTAADWRSMYGVEEERKPDAPLFYQGRFPQNYSVQQKVQQWSPVSLRMLTLEPTATKPPTIDWNDASLITSTGGIQRLRSLLTDEAKKRQVTTRAYIYHAGSRTDVFKNLTQSLDEISATDVSMAGYQNVLFRTRESALSQMLDIIPTMKPPERGFFRIVSQIAPEGAGSLEDLAFVDGSDPSQWGLAIMMYDGKDFMVFRKLYLVKESKE